MPEGMLLNCLMCKMISKKTKNIRPSLKEKDAHYGFNKQEIVREKWPFIFTNEKQFL